MRRMITALTLAAVLTGATPTLAQDSPGFGALVGGLVGGAIDAAAAGRRPRGGDFVPGGSGAGHGGGGHAGGAQAGGGQHRQAQAGGGEHKAAQAGGGGQMHRKQSK